MEKIIDISHHHHVSDWEKVKKNCNVIITKATQGTSFVDNYFVTVIQQCEKRKIPYWLYTYLDKGDELAQAKFLVKTCRDKVGEHFVGYVLDVEAGNTASSVKAAMDYLSMLDHKMMIYTMYAEYDRYKSVIAGRPKKCAWWEARYGLNDGIYRVKHDCHRGVDLHQMYAEYDRYKSVIAGRPKKCAWWEARYGLNDGIYRVKHDCHRGVDLHQYTSSGICPGIPDEIDVNRVTGHGKSLQWFKTPKNKKKEETMTEKKEGCFSINKNADNISEFLHNRGYGAGRHNLSMIAAANYKSKEVRNALFELAQKGNLIKPAGLNKGWKDDSKKD